MANYATVLVRILELGINHFYQSQRMKVFSLFSGIGGFELGIQQALGKENVEIIGYSEIDKFACAVYEHHFPGVKNYGDVTKIDTTTLPEFDVLVGGSPCQDLSVAKNGREGLSGKRSGLFWEYVRILKATKPKWFVLENVESMRCSDRDIITKTLGRYLYPENEWDIID